jgi:L-asparaginase/Glu-tRNA(Gln) amidotransferase subunit D
MFVKLLNHKGRILSVVNKNKLSSIKIETFNYPKKTYVVFNINDTERYKKFFQRREDAEKYLEDVHKNLENSVLYIDLEENLKFW